DLLAQSCGKQKQPVLPTPFVTLLMQLWQEVAGFDDGPGDEVRKERDETRKVPEVAFGGDVAAIDVHGIANGLERVEGDAGRQDDRERRRQRQRRNTGDGVQSTCDVIHGFEEEVEVFEEPEDTEPEADGGDHVGSADRRRLAARDTLSQDKVEYGAR